jgi:WD40 repeat protein
LNFFFCVANIRNKVLTNVLRYLITFLDEITAHSQKVSCLDIGETGRVLVTGGNDRLVNLFAIGNEKSIQV